MKKAAVAFGMILFMCFFVKAQNTLPATGNVGLGVSAPPKEQLQIGDRWTFHNGGSKFIGYNIFYNGSLQRFSPGVASLLSFDGNGEIAIKTAESGTNLNSLNIGLTVQPNGKVGIGHSAPTEQLDILGNLRIRGNILADGADLKLGLFDGRPQGSKLLNRALVHSNTNDALILNYDGDFEGGIEDWGPKMFIKGKLGVGFDTPKEQFQIGDRWTFHNGGVKYIGYNVFYDGQDKRIFSEGSSQIRFGSDGNMTLWTAGGGTANTPVNFKLGVSIQPSGFVGVGESNPQAQLHLPDNAKFRLGPWEFSQEGGGNTTSYLRLNRWTGNSTTQWTDKMLAVDWSGNLFAKSVTVTTDNFPDYVFKKGYQLLPLKDLELFIQKHSRLPEIPSAEEVSCDGINLGEMNKKLLQKIEELTLYTIDQQRQIDELKKQNELILQLLQRK
ncbi:MAG: hypothetical protein LCH81_06700 [Bacteroidetes bacterium]|nr:hypothetical protein [Bacteroidota bacterium]